MLTTESKGFLDRNGVKYLVIILMVLTHIAEVFKDSMPAALSTVFVALGKSVAPVMAYFIAEGYAHTRDITKYRRRLGIFALISWFPCIFLYFGPDGLRQQPQMLIIQSVMTTFYLAVLAMCVWDNKKFSKIKRMILVVLICLISIITDFPVVGVLAPMFHYFLKNDKKKRWICLGVSYLAFFALAFAGKGITALGLLLVPVILLFVYNGQGGRKSAFNKWFFYIFYPAHLVILSVIKWFIL